MAYCPTRHIMAFGDVLGPMSGDDAAVEVGEVDLEVANQAYYYGGLNCIGLSQNTFLQHTLANHCTSPATTPSKITIYNYNSGHIPRQHLNSMTRRRFNGGASDSSMQLEKAHTHISMHKHLHKPPHVGLASRCFKSFPILLSQHLQQPCSGM